MNMIFLAFLIVNGVAISLDYIHVSMIADEVA